MKNIDWKENALSNAEKEKGEFEGIEVYLCPKTDEELYFLINEKKFVFSNFGTCECCKKDFYISALKTPESYVIESWPIHYLGYYCKDCYSKI